MEINTITDWLTKLRISTIIVVSKIDMEIVFIGKLKEITSTEKDITNLNASYKILGINITIEINNLE